MGTALDSHPIIYQLLAAFVLATVWIEEVAGGHRAFDKARDTNMGRAIIFWQEADPNAVRGSVFGGHVTAISAPLRGIFIPIAKMLFLQFGEETVSDRDSRYGKKYALEWVGVFERWLQYGREF